MSQPDKFWDKNAARYSKTPVQDEESYQKKLAVTREYFRPDMDLLEFGCGTGSTAILHAPHVNHILATDVSPNMLEIAQGKADAANVQNITFQQSNIDEFSAPDQSYDMVLGMSILHLLENKEEVIAKVHKLLKPNGLFVSSTMCLGDKMKFIKFIAPIGQRFGLIPTLDVFTAQELTDSITAAGFAIDHHWQPSPTKALFIVAKKVG